MNDLSACACFLSRKNDQKGGAEWSDNGNISM